jgi:hypothetical protein
LAKEAAATGNWERDHNPIAGNEILDSLTHLNDLAHELVTKNVSLFHRWHISIIEMEVGAANRCRSDPNNCITRIDQLGIGNLLNS